ncbi:MAG: hypothetical protein D6771_06000, partial [Zetaproteobacteria bacterium]
MLPRTGARLLLQLYFAPTLAKEGVMRKTILAAAMALLATGAWADETVAVKVGYQIMKPEGIVAGATNWTNQAVNIKNDLTSKDSKKFTGEIALQFGDSRLSVGYLPINISASGKLARTITFGGQTFNVNTPVSLSLKADIYDIAYTYYLINMDDLPSRFQLGLELAVKPTKVQASMQTTGQSAQVSGNAPIPTIGARARVALADFVGVVGRVGYLKVGKNKFMDTDVQVEFSPLPLVGIYGGYRQIKVKV